MVCAEVLYCNTLTQISSGITLQCLTLSLTFALMCTACLLVVEVTAAHPGQGVKWKDIHGAEWSKIDREQVPSWCAAHELRGAPQNDRVKDLVDLVYSKYHLTKKQAQEQPSESGFYDCSLVVDLTQDVRRAASCESHVRSICSGSLFYDFSVDRVITGWEHLSLTGWDAEALATKLRSAKLTPHMVRDLGGECMAAPCITLATLALIFQMGEPIWTA